MGSWNQAVGELHACTYRGESKKVCWAKMMDCVKVLPQHSKLRAMSLELNSSGVTFYLCHVVSVCSWESHFTSLSLYLLSPLRRFKCKIDYLVLKACYRQLRTYFFHKLYLFIYRLSLFSFYFFTHTFLFSSFFKILMNCCKELVYLLYQEKSQ